MTDTLPDAQANELFFTLKLVTGEDILCVLVNQTTEGLVIEDPVIVKSIIMSTEHGLENKLTSCLFMPFSAIRTFYLSFNDVIAFSPLHPSCHILYTNLLRDNINNTTNGIDLTKLDVTNMVKQ